MNSFLTRTLICLWCVLVAAPASATVIIGNLGDISGGGTLVGPSATTVTKDAGWMMGSDSYVLDNAILSLSSFAGIVNPRVSIWSGAAAPTVQLGVLNNPAFAGDGDYTFTPGGTITLVANTTYWLRMEEGAGTDDFIWESGVTTPTGVATHVGYLFNGSPSSFLNTFEINGTLASVLEPGTLALFGLGLAGLGALRRRKAA